MRGRRQIVGQWRLNGRWRRGLGGSRAGWLETMRSSRIGRGGRDVDRHQGGLRRFIGRGWLDGDRRHRGGLQRFGCPVFRPGQHGPVRSSPARVGCRHRFGGPRDHRRVRDSSGTRRGAAGRPAQRSAEAQPPSPRSLRGIPLHLPLRGDVADPPADDERPRRFPAAVRRHLRGRQGLADLRRRGRAQPGMLPRRGEDAGRLGRRAWWLGGRARRLGRRARKILRSAQRFGLGARRFGRGNGRHLGRGGRRARAGALRLRSAGGYRGKRHRAEVDARRRHQRGAERGRRAPGGGRAPLRGRDAVGQRERPVAVVHQPFRASGPGQAGDEAGRAIGIDLVTQRGEKAGVAPGAEAVAEGVDRHCGNGRAQDCGQRRQRAPVVSRRSRRLNRRAGRGRAAPVLPAPSGHWVTYLAGFGS
jgi:hypothetical protein